MSAPSLKTNLLKGLAFFSVLRGYNIILIIIAQYLCSIYILAPEKAIFEQLLDLNLFLLIVCTSLVIAAGYIINNFYDWEKDLINKPYKTVLDKNISQRAKIYAYVIFNFTAIIIAASISFRAVVFFSAYSFSIWLYSHKLKKHLYIGNLMAAALAITPFFTVFVYYKNLDFYIFLHAIYLFLLLLIRELTKDMENLAGDLSQNYQTIPVRFGLSKSKFWISLLTALSFIPSYFLFVSDRIGLMKWYFLLANSLLLISVFWMYQSRSKTDYSVLHIILKIVLALGVFSILLIDSTLF
jgi:4-hydroxybenzoate polyprenyltransferase